MRIYLIFSKLFIPIWLSIFLIISLFSLTYFGHFNHADTVNASALPTIQTLSPADEATDIYASTNLVITFDETVQKGSGDITIHLLSDNSITQTIPITSTAVTISGTQVTIDPPLTLTWGISYYVNIPAGAILDLVTGDPFAGITDTSSWNFTTATAITFPTDCTWTGTTTVDFFGVGETSNPNVTITPLGNEQYLFSDISGAYYAAFGFNSDQPVIVEVQGDEFVIINTTAQTQFNIVADAVSGSYDPVNDIITMPWFDNLNSFGDVTIFTHTGSPCILATSPADDSTIIDVATNLVMTFNEAMQKGSGDITIHLLSDNSITQTIPITGTAVTISGTQVTIDPPLTLTWGISYYVNIPAGAILDLAGNPFAGITDTSSWNFTTATAITFPTDCTWTGTTTVDFFGVGETSNPNVTITPLGNEQYLFSDISGAYYATFGFNSDQPVIVEVQGDEFVIINTTAQTQFNIVADAVSGSYDPVNDIITMPWFDNLNSFGDVTIFTHTGSPCILATSPADDSTIIDVATNLVMTFNEAMQKGSGDITIHLLSDNSVVQTIPVTSTAVVITDTQVTIDPPTNFVAGTAYYVNIVSGTLQNLAGHGFAGIGDSVTWNFALTDTLSPTIQTLSPADEATDIYASTNLVMTFDETVQKGSGDITIHLLSDNSITQTIPITSTAVTISGTQVTIDPPLTLTWGISYYVNIPAGAILDLAGNPFAGITDTSSWNFTTATAITFPTDCTWTGTTTVDFFGVGETSNPNVTITPLGNEQYLFSDISGAYYATFGFNSDQPVIVEVQGDEFVIINTTAQTQFNIVADAVSGSYDPVNDIITMPWFDNLNSFGDVTIFTHTGSPCILATSPADDSTIIDVATNLVMTFNEAMQKGSGDITIHLLSDNSVVQTIPVTSTAVTITNTEVTINPPTDLVSNTTYYINIPLGAFQDLVGNDFAGISDSTTWNFTTISPLTLTGTLVSSGTVRLDWNASNHDAYQLWLSPLPYSAYTLVSTHTESETDVSVDNQQNYYYEIRGVLGATTAESSNRIGVFSFFLITVEVDQTTFTRYGGGDLWLMDGKKKH